MPIHMRLPKLKGFRNRFRTEYAVVNVGDINRAFPQGRHGRVDELVAKGLVRKNVLVKVLGDGKLGRQGRRHRAQVQQQRPRGDHRRRWFGYRAVVRFLEGHFRRPGGVRLVCGGRRARRETAPGAARVRADRCTDGSPAGSSRSRNRFRCRGRRTRMTRRSRECRKPRSDEPNNSSGTGLDSRRASRRRYRAGPCRARRGSVRAGSAHRAASSTSAVSPRRHPGAAAPYSCATAPGCSDPLADGISTVRTSSRL